MDIIEDHCTTCPPVSTFIIYNIISSFHTSVNDSYVSMSMCNRLPLVHKRMFYIRTNLRMLQHSNVECNIRMLILCNKMMYFDDFVVLVACISSEFIFIT